MCYSYFATPTSLLPRALRGRRPYAGGDSRATAAVGGLRQSPGAGRCKPPLPIGHGQRLCPRGRAVAVSLLDGVLWARPHRGAWLFAAFLGLAEATGGLPGRRGREAPTPQGRGPLAPALGGVWRALGPQNAAAPAWPPDLPAPPGNSHIADGCRLGMGEAGAVGYAPGRRRLAAGGGPQGCPRPAKQKSAPGALGPGCALSGRFAPRRRPPPGRWDFAPPPRRGRQGGKPGRSAGLGMADVGPGLSEWLGFCQAVFLWQKEQHPDFLGNKAQIYKL